MGCDVVKAVNLGKNHLFLLTHPVWDVTAATEKYSNRKPISTHTSRVGCDPGCLRGKRTEDKFLLTHPVWDVTQYPGM